MSRSVLLSIKPKYVNAIIRGEKLYEFRKAIYRSNDVEQVYVYASAPIKKIVGRFAVGNILHGTPNEIWNKCSDYGGISKKDFFNYYRNKSEAFSLRISNLEIFEDAICPYTKFEKFTPPQSFMYFDHLKSKM